MASVRFIVAAPEEVLLGYTVQERCAKRGRGSQRLDKACGARDIVMKEPRGIRRETPGIAIRARRRREQHEPKGRLGTKAGSNVVIVIVLVTVQIHFIPNIQRVHRHR